MGIYIKNFTKEDLTEMLYAVPLRYKVPKEGDIIEVAEPHGRLIDTDALARKIVESNYGVDFINKTTALIMDTPTVIDAEGESNADRQNKNQM